MYGFLLIIYGVVKRKKEFELDLENYDGEKAELMVQVSLIGRHSRGSAESIFFFKNERGIVVESMDKYLEDCLNGQEPGEIYLSLFFLAWGNS